MKISDEQRDFQNSRLIQSAFWIMEPRKSYLIYGASPEERKIAAKKVMRLFYILGAMFVSCIIYSYFQPIKPIQLKPAPVIEPAGTITKIELHAAFLSSTTTITTTSGVYQLIGKISASVGDNTKLKTEKEMVLNSIHINQQLCIESKIRNECYPLE